MGFWWTRYTGVLIELFTVALPTARNGSHRNTTQHNFSSAERRLSHPMPSRASTLPVAPDHDYDRERAHIIERGISPMTVMDFQLGYSPADLTSPLIEYLDQVCKDTCVRMYD